MEFERKAEDFERDLAQRPGFLIRKLHQIHLALFAEECNGFDITPVQYGILAIIAQREGMDQSQISEESGVDRAALAKVVARLEDTGFLKHITSQLDRRQKLLSLTARGRTIFESMQGPVARAHARTIEPLSPLDQNAFMSMLATLVDAAAPMGRPKLRLK